MRAAEASVALESLPTHNTANCEPALVSPNLLEACRRTDSSKPQATSLPVDSRSEANLTLAHNYGLRTRLPISYIEDKVDDDSVFGGSQGTETPFVPQGLDVSDDDDDNEQDSELFCWGSPDGGHRGTINISTRIQGVVHLELAEDMSRLETREMELCLRAITTTKEFVEQNFGAICSCDHGRISPATDGVNDRPMGLGEMARFWKSETKILDAIRSPTVVLMSLDNDLLNWRQALAGDERPPRLSFSLSQSELPDMGTWWDIDSMICKANCLSIMREGIDISYHPQPSRNIHKDLRVTVNGRALNKTVHLRLGSGRRTPELGIYIYFPNILMQTQGDRLADSGQYKRRSTYLTNSQHEVWVDKQRSQMPCHSFSLLLPPSPRRAIPKESLASPS